MSIPALLSMILILGTVLGGFIWFLLLVIKKQKG